MRLLLAAIVLGLSFSPASADPAADGPSAFDRAGGPRVRPNDSRVATLLKVGLERSPTLRSLIDRVEDSQVIVYLEMQPRLRHHLSGSVTWVTAAAGYRYVRASINPALGFDQQIAAVGHELQHVLEIVDHADVVNERALVSLYRRIGHRPVYDRQDWDTDAAQDAGEQVRSELADLTAIGPRAIGAISPRDWHTYYVRERAGRETASAGGRSTAPRMRFEE